MSETKKGKNEKLSHKVVELAGQIEGLYEDMAGEDI